MKPHTLYRTHGKVGHLLNVLKTAHERIDTQIHASAILVGVISFTTRPLYSQGKSFHYPLDMRLVGPQSQSGNFFPFRESNSEPSAVQTVARVLKLYV
jgi:hypothetical protein